MWPTRALIAAISVCALALAGAPGAAAAVSPSGVVTDACEDAANPDQDLTRVAFDYSATSFQVRTESCGWSSIGSSWQVTLHVVSFTPEVQISGAMNDAGKYAYWTGFHLCAGGDCVTDPMAYPITPGGKPLPGFDYFDNLDAPALSGRSAFGYGRWADLLPGVTIPDAIDWYAEIRNPVAALDRAPDEGVATSGRLAVTRPSVVTVDAAATRPVTWSHGSALQEATGRLNYLVPPNHPVPNRFVTIRLPSGATRQGHYGPLPDCPECGQWRTFFRVFRNTTVRASFDGDGFTDPASVTYRALVAAYVTLDRPASTSVRRGTPVRLRGVVRPAARDTSVTIQVRRSDGWHAYRTLPLKVNNGDTYYDYTWVPVTTGTATFRTVWTAGSTAEDAICDGASRAVTISVGS